ncbi:class I SAM-dependent methyltransferase [Kineobactrum sediminis]|nr:methyltransferase domain-containing protein [Kineobactrum sediminis]
MHSKKGSLLKRWHSATISPKTCASKWQGQYWEDQDEDRVVSCASCRSFDPANTRCSINFGTPLRKCVVSSIEAHFHNCKGEEVLEIGFGRFKLARNLIVRSGGRWTGVDPQQDTSRKLQLGSGGYGHASELPFADATFDRVFGVQSIEHWGQRAGGVRTPSSYSDCFQEIARVLKPGGSIYFDAPVHFHGNEMFIMGDTEKLRSLFDPAVWTNVNIERWREDSTPLERYTPSPTEFRDWPVEIVSYPAPEVARAKAEGVVWLLVVTAQKVTT